MRDNNSDVNANRVRFHTYFRNAIDRRRSSVITEDRLDNGWWIVDCADVVAERRYVNTSRGHPKILVYRCDTDDY